MAVQAISPQEFSCRCRSLRFWIETNVLLLLKDAPFDKRNAHLVAIAGSCVDCPSRTGHNKLLFADLGKQDACTQPKLLSGEGAGARRRHRRGQAQARADQHGLLRSRRRVAPS